MLELDVGTSGLGRAEGAIAARPEIEPRGAFVERLRSDAFWQTLALEVYAASGESLFADLAARLSDALDAELALIGEIADDDPGAIDAVAVSIGGAPGRAFRYASHGGPFADVLARGATCCFVAGAAERFPADPVLRGIGAVGCIGLPLIDAQGGVIGLIAVATARPIEASDIATSIVRFFAVRAGPELARRRAERALDRQRTLIEAIAASTPDLIYVKDREGRYLFTNAAAACLAGLPEAGILGRDDAELFPPRVASHLQENDRAVLASGRPRMFEEAVGNGAARRVLQSYKAPLRDARGGIVGVVGVSRDVTAARRTDEARTTLLRVAHEVAGTLDRGELIRRVQEHVAAGLPCDRVVTYFRSPSEGSFGMVGQVGMPEDLLQDCLELRFLPGDPILDANLRGEATSIHVSDANPLLPRPVLEHFRVSALATAPLVVRGRVLGVLAAVRDQRGPDRPFDADDLQLLESLARQLGVGLEAADLFEARDREAQIASALAYAGQELLHALDMPEILEHICRVTTEAMGAASSFTFLVDRTADAFVPVASHGARPGAWDAVRLSQIRLDYNAEMVAALRSGRIVWLGRDRLPAHDLGELARGLGVTALGYIPLRRGGEVVGVQVAVYRDEWPLLTPARERIAAGLAHLASLAIAHREAIRELERANTIKSEFVATMSHELRTPLNVIIGYDDLLIEGAFGPIDDSHAAVLRRVGLAARELLDLVDNTLNLSRLESAPTGVDVSDVDLAALLGEIAFETRELGESRGLCLTVEIEPGGEVVRTDRGKLKLVLKNLVTNALKFTDAGSVVAAASARGAEVWIAVRDTGAGIEPEAMPLIFEAFRQGGDRRERGVGLGLYIVRRLVDLLGGSIEVESAPGRGSTFTVALPAAGVAAGAPGAHSAR